MGVNTKDMTNKTPVSSVIIDNKYLTNHGIHYFCVFIKTICNSYI